MNWDSFEAPLGTEKDKNRSVKSNFSAEEDFQLTGTNLGYEDSMYLVMVHSAYYVVPIVN